MDKRKKHSRETQGLSQFFCNGDLSGITSKNKPNATYQSMIDGELMYEYAIHRFNKNKTKAAFWCAGCRSAISDGRGPEC